MPADIPPFNTCRKAISGIPSTTEWLTSSYWTPRLILDMGWSALISPEEAMAQKIVDLLALTSISESQKYVKR